MTSFAVGLVKNFAGGYIDKINEARVDRMEKWKNFLDVENPDYKKLNADNKKEVEELAVKDSKAVVDKKLVVKQEILLLRFLNKFFCFFFRRAK